MNIVFCSKGGGRLRMIPVLHPGLVLTLLVLLAGFGSAVFYAGYRTAGTTDNSAAKAMVGRLQADLAHQRDQVQSLRDGMRAQMDALSLRLGEAQANVIRLNALGQRLTKMAGLDSGEFDFKDPPAQGGPVDSHETDRVDVHDFSKSLAKLALQLDDREQQLNVLETLLMSRNLHHEVFPAGRPVRHGWMSSPYGWRTDPFNGKKEFHPGIDFANKRGTPIIAVASGVVTWSSKRYGYGNMVEIDHGNGYETRYGHAEKLLVKVGQTVKKGQPIALMGSTGRSTGPHVHFEVRFHGRTVNPAKYVNTAAN